MNYYRAIQHTTSKRWSFGFFNDHKAYLANCCRDHEGKHETREEAERCFYDDQIARAREISIQDQQLKCRVCGDWTAKGMETPMHHMEMLCDKHLNKDGLMQAYPFRPGIEGAASWEP